MSDRSLTPEERAAHEAELNDFMVMVKAYGAACLRPELPDVKMRLAAIMVSASAMIAMRQDALRSASREPEARSELERLVTVCREQYEAAKTELTARHYYPLNEYVADHMVPRIEALVKATDRLSSFLKRHPDAATLLSGEPEAGADKNVFPGVTRAKITRLASVARERARVAQARYDGSGEGDKARASHLREAKDFFAITEILERLEWGEPAPREPSEAANLLALAAEVEKWPVRLAILAGRIKACREESRGHTHDLVDEAEAFADEARGLGHVAGKAIRLLVSLSDGPEAPPTSDPGSLTIREVP